MSMNRSGSCRLYPEESLSIKFTQSQWIGRTLPLAGSVLETLVGVSSSSYVQTVSLPRQQGVVTLRRISSVWTKS